MGKAGPPLSPDRDKTDESLRTERERSDRVLAERQVAAEENADEVVQRARDNADAVMVAARAEADERQAGEAEASGAIVEERQLQDEALREEREAADERLRQERDTTRKVLSTLLPLEREMTDRYLLTERARSDAAVAHRDDFLGMVSHDLRNLLGGIVTSASLMSEQAGAGEEGNPTRLGSTRILRYAARMSRLIGDLVDVASIDGGKFAMAPSLSDGSALIGEVIEMFHAAAEAKGLSLTGEVGERPLLAPFDHDRLLQVLANFVANAIKFTPEGGRIEVRADRHGANLRFMVSDTGIGIPEGMLEAVFRRFWQVGTNDRRGIGLGLYISKCIVDGHGGRIWAESALGAGSRFFFTVPASG